MHHERLAVLARITLALSLIAGTVAARAQQNSDVLIPIAPCRILDTASSPPASGDHEREVSLGATRCGRVIPAFAKAYSIVVTRTSQTAPEKLPAGTGRVIETARKVPAPASGRMAFPLPPGDHLAVDAVGYYVAAGTPVNPNAASQTAEKTAVLAPTSAGPAANAFVDGTAGSLYLNGGAWSIAGVYMLASASNPWIVAQLGTGDGSSAFAFYKPGGIEMMRFRSDGVMQMSSNANLYDGRTDFFGIPTNGSVSVPTNVIHDATLVNPRDATGGSTSRVVFYNAWTGDETGSPATTKFQARTGGYHGQENVNFHSIIGWHMPNQYHFRATSNPPNSIKDTFWVKAATNTDSVTNTRADLYLDGRAGIGTPNPDAALHVEDLARDVEMILGSGDDPGVPHAPTLTLMRKDGNNNQAAKYGFRLDSNDGNKLKLLYGGTGAYESAPLLYIDPAATARTLHFNGEITGTKVIATYQDVAEWVPAAADMTPGTVVILNPDKSNEVMPSAHEYDTRVAGVVSAEPGVLLGIAGDSKEMIATTGRVKVNVDATRSPVRIGDLLVSSGKPGMAMKSLPVDVGGIPIHRPGTIIGKALEPLESGEGEILVLLSLQ